MEQEDVLLFSSSTIGYLENDKKSLEHVIDNDDLEGKLGFGMITTAMAACDTYAYLLYDEGGISNTERFKRLIKDSPFFNESKYLKWEVFYKIIRNGVIHQLYPKNMSIIADTEKESILYKDSDNKIIINAYALYCDVLRGIKEIHEYLRNLSENERLPFSEKLSDRRSNDRTVAENNLSTTSQTQIIESNTTLTENPSAWANREE